MSIRSWKRLAGCIAIECLLLGAAPEYRVGTAAAGSIRAMAIEDRRGARAVIAEAGFPIDRATADFVAAQLAKDYDLERAAILLRGAGKSSAEPADILTTIAAALGALTPARIATDGATLSATTTEGHCMASFPPLKLSDCRAGRPAGTPLRAAFQMVEPPHPLEKRGETPASFPLQAISLGRQPILLALPGDVAPDRFRAAGRIVVDHANDSRPLPETPAVDAAVRQLIERVTR